jgi:phosphoribosylcarboxyaminoimidazole (NCAIR) mutase
VLAVATCLHQDARCRHHTLPVIGVYRRPVAKLDGLDSLLSIVQITRPCGFGGDRVSIGGTFNTGLLAIQFSTSDPVLLDAHMSSISRLQDTVEAKNAALKSSL